jgi:hypothetical protein
VKENILKWHFPSTDSGDEDGINDPLRETFEGDHERYIARESIQNSLDARKDKTKPVLVKFERYNLPVSQVPGLSELKETLKRAKEYSHDQDKSEEFYGSALELLERPTLSVLKVSDFNTIGLNGSDDDTGGGWYKLTRGTGVNAMHGVGGGSFGIGKGAPFAASGLRVVFYSTINQQGEHVFKGKARLSSFRNAEGDVRRGIGDYGQAINRGVSSIREIENIPDFFQRKEQGTDLFIVGYRTEEQDWTRLLLNSLLNNFWAAVHFNELDVQLFDNGKLIHQVDETNLGELMAEYASEAHEFYKAITDPTAHMKDTLPHLKEVSLYVRTGEKLPRAVQMMRSSKMVVQTVTNYRVLPQPYVAVFICDSEQGNRLLRELEPPAHDKWDRDRNKVFGKKVYRELRNWVKESLRSIADEKDSQPEDIPELSRWLPEDVERDDINPQLGSIGLKTDAISNLETAREIGANQKEADLGASTTKPREVALTQGFARGGEATPIGIKPVKNKSHNATIDLTTSGEVPRINTANIRFRCREILRDNRRMFQATISSSHNEAGAIKIMAVGDDADYPVELESVFDGNNQPLEVNGALIKGLELIPNESIRLIIELKNHKRYALGVE